MRTQACRLCIVPFCTDSGSIAIQTCCNVGRAAECTIEHERFPVAHFGQGIVLLLASQVTKQGHEDGNIPGYPDGLCQGQGFFQERRSACHVTPHSCQSPKKGQSLTYEATMLNQPGMRITCRIGSLRLIELAARLGEHTERREGIADAVVVTKLPGQLEGFVRRGFGTTLHLAMAHHGSPYAIEPLYT